MQRDVCKTVGSRGIMSELFKSKRKACAFGRHVCEKDEIHWNWVPCREKSILERIQ